MKADSMKANLGSRHLDGHQQKIMMLVCGYIAIYSDNINSILEIQVFIYMRIHTIKYGP